MVVQLDLSIPILHRPLAWGVQGWFVVRFKDDVRFIFVPRGIQRPEVTREVHTMNGTILTIASDGQNHIQTRFPGGRHQSICIRKIHPDRIWVLRGIAFEVHMNSVQSKGVGQPLQLRGCGDDLGLAPIRIASIPRKRYASQTGLLVGHDGVEAKGRVNDRPCPWGIGRGVDRQ